MLFAFAVTLLVPGVRSLSFTRRRYLRAIKIGHRGLSDRKLFLHVLNDSIRVFESSST
jgi:hypothetical protein